MEVAGSPVRPVRHLSERSTNFPTMDKQSPEGASTRSSRPRWDGVSDRPGRSQADRRLSGARGSRRIRGPAAGLAPSPQSGPLQLTLFPLHPFSSLPRAQLYELQNGRCARCAAPVSPDARLKWDRNRTRIAGLVCHGCSLRSAPLPGPSPVELAIPLLRLRLSLGPIPSGDMIVSQADRSALLRRGYDHFRNSTHALWVYQGGRCALDHPTLNPHRGSRGLAIRLDHKHDVDGLARGLLCQSCNCLEGKGGGAGSAGRVRLFDLYRRYPPAQAFEPTRGLTRAYLKSWPVDVYNQLMARAGVRGDADFFWAADA